MSNRMFENMGFGMMMPKMFRGFDDIESQLMDFSNRKLSPITSSTPSHDEPTHVR